VHPRHARRWPRGRGDCADAKPHCGSDGAGPDRGIDIERPETLHLNAFGLPAELQAQLLGRRPDLVAARWRAEAAAKRIHVAQAQFYPISISPPISASRRCSPIFSFKPSSQIGSVDLRSLLPIFEAAVYATVSRRALGLRRCSDKL